MQIKRFPIATAFLVALNIVIFAVGMLSGSQTQIIQNYGFIPIHLFYESSDQEVEINNLDDILDKIHCLHCPYKSQNNNHHHHHPTPWQHYSHPCSYMPTLHILHSIYLHWFILVDMRREQLVFLDTSWYISCQELQQLYFMV